MRLNWSNLGKGLEAIANAKIARDVAKAGNKAPGVTEGAYGSGLQDNIEQVRGLRSQAAQEASYNTGGSEDAIAAAEQQYNPALEELQRRAGLTQADYSVGGSPNYSSRERAMAEQGLMRSQREAEAYRKFGMVDKANEVEGLALNRKLQLTQEERALSAEARAQAGETRAGKQFTAEQAQRELGLVAQQRTAAEAANMDAFNASVAKLDPAMQQDPDTLLRLAKESKLTPAQINATVESVVGLDKGTMALMDSYIDKQFKASPTIEKLAVVYKTDAKFDDKSHFVYDTDPKTGAVTVTFVQTNEDGSDGPAIGRPRVFRSEDEAIGQLQAEAKDPKAKANWAVAERDRKIEDKKLENDVERVNIARQSMETSKKSLSLDQKRFLETQAVNDREKLRAIQQDGLSKRLTEAQIKNTEAETLLRETKAKGKLTDDDILKATLRLMTADPELDPKTAAKRVRAAASAINQDEEAMQAAALRKLQEANASRSGGRAPPPPPVGLQ